MTTKQRDQAYIADTYGRFDVEITHGKGSLVYDETGKEYIDLSTGIAVNTFGIADEAWTQAVTKQLGKVQHTSNLYYSEPCTRVAELLCERTGAKRVFFGNSGAEANECAIKTARKWAQDTKGVGDYAIITLKNSFHGRTIATLKATGQDVFHTDFGPFPDGFFYAEVGDVDGMRALIEAHPCCAVMMELVQGEGGVLPLDKAYVQAVQRLCREKDLLLIIDEVQTGNGRTGTLYAYMQYDIMPDMVTTAKGLGGGLPIGATMLFSRVAATLTRGSHGSTYGGNPIACAGAYSILSRIDDTVLQGVCDRAAYIQSELCRADGVVSVRGLGLMIGIETVGNADEIVKECMQNGVLPIKAKKLIRLLPALNIPMEQLKKAVDVLKKAVAHAAAIYL